MTERQPAFPWSVVDRLSPDTIAMLAAHYGIQPDEQKADDAQAR